MPLTRAAPAPHPPTSQETSFGASTRGGVSEISSAVRNADVASYLSAAAANATQVYPGAYAQFNTWLYKNWAMWLQLQENLFATQDASWAFWKGRMQAWQKLQGAGPADRLGFFVNDVAAAANKNLLPFFQTSWGLPLNGTSAALQGGLPAWSFNPAATIP